MNQSSEESVAKEEKKDKVLSIRLPYDWYQNFTKIIDNNYHPGAKISTTAKQYLKLSEFLLIRSNQEKYDYNNEPLCIIPQKMLALFFDLIQNQNEPLIERHIKIGDFLARYYNDCCKVQGNTIMEHKIKMIRMSGLLTLPEDSQGRFLIPKSFGPEEMIHAFVYRLLYDTALDNTLNAHYIENQIEQYKYHEDQKDKSKRKEYKRLYDHWIELQQNLPQNIQDKLYTTSEEEQLSGHYIFDLRGQDLEE